MLLLDLSICGSSDVLRVLYFIKLLLNIVFIIVPIGLIILIMFDLSKSVISGDKEEQKKKFNLALKRILYAILVFCVPSIVSMFNSILGDLGVDYSVCLNNITKEQIEYLDSIEFSINEAEKYVRMAEKKLTDEGFEKAQEYVDNVKDEEMKQKLQNRLEIAIEYAEEHAEEIAQTKLSYDSLSSVGNCNPGSDVKVLSSEPEPSCAINRWKTVVDANDFIYPKVNGMYLGAWPKNYANISTKLSNPKTYVNGKFIWPVDPANGKYRYVYEHDGIDIMTYMGTPIYSPVDGELIYSEWGHTVNVGSDETAYSLAIKMNSPLVYDGKTYGRIYLTHMSGIIYRCRANSCNKTLSKGDLIGFVGTAAGTAESSGYAPHLHMTIYYDGPNGDLHGLTTSDIQKLYNLNCGSNCKDISIKAGG